LINNIETQITKADPNCKIQDIDNVNVESVVPLKQVPEIAVPKNKRRKTLETSESSDEPALKNRRNNYQTSIRKSVDVENVVRDILNDILSGVVFQSQALNSRDTPDIWEALMATARPVPEIVSISSPEMRMSSEIETDAEDDSSLFLAGRVDINLRNCLPYQVWLYNIKLKEK